MIIDEMCVMCERDAGEDVEHLLVKCGGFERDRLVLTDEVSRIVEAREWLEEYGRVCKEIKVALLLGKKFKGIGNTVMRMEGMYYVLDRELVADKEGVVVWRANGQILVPSPPPSMNSWTQHMHHYYHIFLTDLFGRLHHLLPKFETHICSCHNFFSFPSVQILLISACCLLCVL